MSRVTDAMRRAGELRDEPADSNAEDMPFAAVEGQADEPAPPPILRMDPEQGRVPGTLARRHQVVPIDLTRKPSSDDVQILDVLRILHRRRWLVALVVLAAVGLAMAYNRMTTPIYEARARLLIEPNSPEVVPFRTMTDDPARLDYYITQLEVLRSRELIRRTLERLKLLPADESQQSAQIGQLLSQLAVAPVRTEMGESRIINVTYRDPDPQLAARVANGLAQTYVDQNLDSRRQGSRDAFEWLNQRLEELRREVGSREEALQQYRRQQENAVALGDQQNNIVVQKLAQLNTALTTARTERLAQEALYQQLASIQKSGAPLDTFSPILANTFIQGLKNELATLERQRDQLSEQLGDLHPDMIKVNTAIANLQRQLKAEMTKVVDGVENDYRAAKTKEAGLSSALEDQKREMLSLNQNSVGFSALQRDAASTQQMFETVRQRVKETEIAGELQSNNAKVLDLAEIPGAPVLPRTLINLLVAFLGGTCAAIVLALGLEYLNPRLEKPGDIAEALGLPLLGVAPTVSRLKNRTPTLDDLPQPFHTAFRSIRTRILLSPIAGSTRSIAVTSTTPKEGKTLVASNLAISLVMAGRRVLLVDADLHRPQLHRMFNLSRSPGLAEVLAGTNKPSETLREASLPGLFVLPAGGAITSPTDLLDSERLHHLIDGLSRVFDVVVLDCPPVMAVADASIVGHAAASVLFVVGAGSTTREAARAALDRLSGIQVQVLGVVVNKAERDRAYEYGYEVAMSEDMA